MSRLTVFKKVFWKEAGREVSGKVKQILHDHVVVATSSGEYIVHKNQVYMKKTKEAEDAPSSPPDRLL